jgi:hypothetical protein
VLLRLAGCGWGQRADMFGSQIVPPITNPFLGAWLQDARELQVNNKSILKKRPLTPRHALIHVKVRLWPNSLLPTPVDKPSDRVFGEVRISMLKTENLVTNLSACAAMGWSNAPVSTFLRPVHIHVPREYEAVGKDSMGYQALEVSTAG